MSPPFLLSRRHLLRLLGAAGVALPSTGLGPTPKVHAAVSAQVETPLPYATGPEPSPYWNAVGPLRSLPQKVPLIQLTDRPVQLETPRHYFLEALTPTAAFFVRWHLPWHPRSVDLAAWRLQILGHLEKPLQLSFAQLLSDFAPVTVTAVNQCAGNSRSRFSPRVPGSQWGNGAMACGQWTGVRLRDLLSRAGVKKGALQVQFAGLDQGAGPEGSGAARFLKSLDLASDAMDEAILAYACNGEPLPLLNGFPLRLVVPGYFATYWVKALSVIRVLNQVDDNFWMKTAYRIPNRPQGAITPAELAAGPVPTIPLGRMPVRSFLISPDGSSKLPQGLAITLRGIAFSGWSRVNKVEWSADSGHSWNQAQLGAESERYGFRTWSARFTPKTPGRYVLSVRATDGSGNTQSDAMLWNPGGYLWNKIERQEVIVGPAA